MQIGSPKHKTQFLEDLTRTYQENIWKEEMQVLELEELLRAKRKEKAALDLQLS